ncbi:hypothetical protein ACFX2I_013888 [Malus domestica]
MLPNSKAIAVKELKSMNQGEKQFPAEVGTISVIQHINLIRMRGFCANASKRFLVYDYMPNGSLQSLLLRKNPIMLDWKARYHIAVVTARGLAYLHDECRDCWYMVQPMINVLDYSSKQEMRLELARQF